MPGKNSPCLQKIKRSHSAVKIATTSSNTRTWKGFLMLERKGVIGFLRRIHESILKAGAPARQSVVIESDWPEYNFAWAMIEHRIAGKPVPDFNLWRRADELQQSLTETEQRADDLQTQLEALEQRRRAEFEAGAVAERRVEVLEGLLRTSLIAMKRIYQAGYDRIVDAGGSCDTPEYMMENDPTAREIRSTLNPATESASHD